MFHGPDQSVGARREAPCRCLSQASDAGSGEGLGGDSLRKAGHEEDRKSYNPIPCFFFLWSCLVSMGRMGRGSTNDWRSLSLFPGPQIRQLVARQGRSGLLITTAAVAALALVIIVGPPIPPATSIQTSGIWDVLYRDGWWKQATGFGLLGCVLAAASGFSLRKRWRRVRFGSLWQWRLAHGAVALLALMALIAHTGLRLGSGFNQALMFSFLAATLFGTAASSGQRPPARSCDVLAPPSRRLAASRVTHFPHLVVLLLLMPCAPAVSRPFGS